MTGDDKRAFESCRSLFQRLHDNSEQVVVIESVIAEVVFVLSSPKLYNLSPREIVDRLKPLIVLKGVSIQNKKTICEALDLYAFKKNLDFTDALQYAHMSRMIISEIYSYDKHSDLFPSHIKRVVPK